jgi:hypothetical protein
MADASEYEVRCPRCDVSFPTGTRKCLHCGGATGPSRGPRGRTGLRERAPSSVADGSPDPKRFELAEVRPAEPIDADEEAAPPRRASALLRGIATVVWIAIAIGISLARSCEGNG